MTLGHNKQEKEFYFLSLVHLGGTPVRLIRLIRQEVVVASLMAAGRTRCILRLFVLVLLHGALFKENAQFIKLSL